MDAKTASAYLSENLPAVISFSQRINPFSISSGRVGASELAGQADSARRRQPARFLEIVYFSCIILSYLPEAVFFRGISRKCFRRFSMRIPQRCPDFSDLPQRRGFRGQSRPQGLPRPFCHKGGQGHIISFRQTFPFLRMPFLKRCPGFCVRPLKSSVPA